MKKSKTELTNQEVNKHNVEENKKNVNKIKDE